MHFKSALPDPPAYKAEDSPASYTRQNKSSRCSHGQTRTPLLDSYLSKPIVQARLQALSAAIAETGSGESCTKCSAERIAGVLNDCLRDLRVSKETGQWDKEEKKQLKMESKGLFKSLKRDMKSAWKAKRSPGP